MRVRLLAVSVGLLLTSCAAPSQLVVQDRPPSQTSFRLTDARNVLSRVGGVDGSTTSYGDSNLKPSPPELVLGWLQDSLVEELRGKHVVLENFDFGSRKGYAANRSTPPGIEAMNYLMAPMLVVLRIDGKVNAKTFSVAVDETVHGPLTGDLLRAVLARGKTELIGQVQRAAAGS
jgi:hypothetical protein